MSGLEGAVRLPPLCVVYAEEVGGGSFFIYFFFIFAISPPQSSWSIFSSLPQLSAEGLAGSRR